MTLEIDSILLGIYSGLDEDGYEVWDTACCAGEDTGTIPASTLPATFSGVDEDGDEVWDVNCCMPDGLLESSTVLAVYSGRDEDGDEVWEVAKPCCANQDENPVTGCEYLAERSLVATMTQCDVAPCLEGASATLTFQGYHSGSPGSSAPCQYWGGVIQVEETEDFCTLVIFYVCVYCYGPGCSESTPFLNGGAVLGIAPPNPASICNIGGPGPSGNQSGDTSPVDFELYEDNGGSITRIQITE